MSEEAFELDVVEARNKIGHLWGMDRALTKMELARALKLSPKYGGDHISKLEKSKTALSGPVYVCITALMDGYVPRHMSEVVKAGYPRGGVVYEAAGA